MKFKLAFVLLFLLNRNVLPCAEEIKDVGEEHHLEFTTAQASPVQNWDAAMKPPFAFGANLYVAASSPTPAPTAYNGPWLYYKWNYGGVNKSYNILSGGDGIITWLDTTNSTGLTYNWYSQIAFQGNSWATFRSWLLDASKNNGGQKPLTWPLGNNMPQFVEVGGYDPITGAPFVVYQWQVQPAWRNPSANTAKILTFVKEIFSTFAAIPDFY